MANEDAKQDNNSVHSLLVVDSITGETIRLKANAFGELMVVSSGGSSGGGSASGGGLNTYYAKPSGVNADATSAYSAGTVIAVTGLAYLFALLDIESIDRYNSSGVYQDTITPKTEDITVAGTQGNQTITVTGATFTAGDQFKVTFSLDPKTINESNDTQKNEVVSQSNKPYDENPLWIDETNVAASTYRSRLKTADHSAQTIHVDCAGGVTVTLWKSNLTDPSTSADTDWVQDTSFPATVDTKTAYAINNERWTWLMIKYVTSDTSNTMQASINRANN